jgi:hypothetical protein
VSSRIDTLTLPTLLPSEASVRGPRHSSGSVMIFLKMSVARRAFDHGSVAHALTVHKLRVLSRCHHILTRRLQQIRADHNKEITKANMHTQSHTQTQLPDCSASFCSLRCDLRHGITYQYARTHNERSHRQHRDTSTSICAAAARCRRAACSQWHDTYAHSRHAHAIADRARVIVLRALVGRHLLRNAYERVIVLEQQLSHAQTRDVHYTHQHASSHVRAASAARATRA